MPKYPDLTSMLEGLTRGEFDPAEVAVLVDNDNISFNVGGTEEEDWEDQESLVDEEVEPRDLLLALLHRVGFSQAETI